MTSGGYHTREYYSKPVVRDYVLDLFPEILEHGETLKGPPAYLISPRF